MQNPLKKRLKGAEIALYKPMFALKAAASSGRTLRGCPYDRVARDGNDKTTGWKEERARVIGSSTALGGDAGAVGPMLERVESFRHALAAWHAHELSDLPLNEKSQIWMKNLGIRRQGRSSWDETWSADFSGWSERQEMEACNKFRQGEEVRKRLILESTRKRVRARILSNYYSGHVAGGELNLEAAVASDPEVRKAEEAFRRAEQEATEQLELVESSDAVHKVFEDNYRRLRRSGRSYKVFVPLPFKEGEDDPMREPQYREVKLDLKPDENMQMPTEENQWADVDTELRIKKFFIYGGFKKKKGLPGLHPDETVLVFDQNFRVFPTMERVRELRAEGRFGQLPGGANEVIISF